MLFGNSFANVVTNDMDCKVIATSSALSHLQLCKLTEINYRIPTSQHSANPGFPGLSSIVRQGQRQPSVLQSQGEGVTGREPPWLEMLETQLNPLFESNISNIFQNPSTTVTTAGVRLARKSSVVKSRHCSKQQISQRLATFWGAMGRCSPFQWAYYTSV